MTNTDYVNAAAREVTHALGPVHVLSNNAGVVVPQGPITGKREADWRFVFEVNLFGIVNCVQAFLPQMRAHGRGGHIVNTKSRLCVHASERPCACDEMFVQTYMHACIQVPHMKTTPLPLV